MMDKFKLQWKVFAYLFGFCALLLVIFWLFQTVLLKDMYKLIRRNEIENAVALVEKNIDSPNLQSLLADLETEKEIIVRLSKEFRPNMRMGRDNAGRGRMESITREKDFTLKNGKVISLTFHAIITPVNATVSTLEVQLYIITVIMILLSVGLALIIARRVSKPIVEINKSAKELARGNYHTDFNGQGFLEIKELSDTLNTAATELSKVENLRKELMANISHDLRTPLALIYSYAEIMHDFPEENTPERTQTIMDEAKRLTSLVNDVLDVSKLETGTSKLNLQQYNLTKSIAGTVVRMAELVKNHGYTLSFEYEEDVYVFADEVKITQAFYNLLINAVNYSGDDKKVWVKQSISGGFVNIEVTDNGEGIAKENLSYIWDRYYKFSKNHKRPVTGTGLGLSIVKKIIELHGGEYGVQSEPGKGSTFRFSLKI